MQLSWHLPFLKFFLFLDYLHSSKIGVQFIGAGQLFQNHSFPLRNTVYNPIYIENLSHLGFSGRKKNLYWEECCPAAGSQKFWSFTFRCLRLRERQKLRWNSFFCFHWFLVIHGQHDKHFILATATVPINSNSFLFPCYKFGVSSCCSSLHHYKFGCSSVQASYFF
jgi:hypothetical protein